MSSSTHGGPSGSIARRALLLIAIAVPLFPAGAWMREALQMYAMGLDAAFLGLYLPARLLALIGLVLMFYQFVLASRLSFMERLYRRASLLKAHRTVGKIAYLLVLLHGVAMLAFDLVVVGEIFLFTEKTLGLIALVGLSAAVVAAWFFKPLKLSLRQWRAIHLLTWLVFPIVVLHALALGTTTNSVPLVRALFTALLVGYVALLLYRFNRLRRETKAG